MKVRLEYPLARIYENIVYVDNSNDQAVMTARLTQMPSCCGIYLLREFIIGNYDWFKANRDEMAREIVKTISPLYRLVMMTHNETQLGKEILDSFTKAGFVDIEQVWSNDNPKDRPREDVINSKTDWPKYIHLLKLEGTLE